MDNAVTLIGYHATDRQYVDSIIKDGFICKKNIKHWLGNGLYFFRDKSLADWWTQNPTSKFGAGINTASILQVNIQCEQAKIIDLTLLDGYNQVHGLFTEFYLLLSTMNKEVGIENRDELRCAFFDWLHSEYECEVIVAAFYKRKADYVEEENHDVFLEFALPYMEVQICVFDNINISTKKVVC